MEKPSTIFKMPPGYQSQISNLKFLIFNFKSQISNLKFLIFNFKFLISYFLILFTLPALAQSSLRHDLSGQGAYTPVLWEFFGSQGPKSGEWTRIPVPGCLESHDFSKSTFGTDFKPDDLSANGLYRLGFRPPESFLNKRVFVVFDGVMTDANVKIDGELLGTHQGGFTPFSYEITQHLKFNQENLLEVYVTSKSADSSVNSAERRGPFLTFSGIHRRVYLLAYPKEFIDTAHINAQSTGELSLTLHVDGLSAADTVKAQVLFDEKPIGNPFSATLDKESASAILSAQIPNPKLWTSETPNLYSLQITLLSGDHPIHVLTRKFGFKTVELRKGAGLFVNGTRVLLKGISIDPYSEKYARSIPPSQSRSDAQLIKSLNANAVSLAHFPANDDFLDACDELGLYVVDTLPGAGANVYSPEVGQKIAAELLNRDLNHPSVIAFSTPNNDLDEFFASSDPQKRPVIHPQPTRPSWAQLSQLAGAEDPFFALDALPSPNSDSIAAGLSDAMGLFQKSPSAAGLFIRAVPAETADSKPQPLAAVPAIAQIFSPIQIQPTTQPFTGQLTIANHSDFANLKDYKASWITVSYPKPADKKPGLSLAQGKLELPDAAPGASANATLKWLNDPAADAVKLTLKDPQDTEIQTLVFSLRAPGYYANAIEKSALSSLVTLDEEADAWLLSGLAGSIRIDKQTATIKSASYANKTIPFTTGPTSTAGPSRLASLSKISEDDAKGLLATFSEGELRSVQWLLLPSGWFKLSYALQATGPHASLGVTFKLDTLKTLSFVGEGPSPLFKNRLQGNTLGAWSLDDFSGSLANVRHARLNTAAGPLHLVIDDPALFLRLSSKEIGILHAIPPSAGIDAPSSLPTDANGAYHGTIYFKFGE